MASLKYLTHLNLNGNQLQGAAIEALGTAPSNNLQTGRVYYDTAGTPKVFKIYDGSNFVSITGDITAVTSSTTPQLTVANENGPIPSFSIVTAVIADSGTGLATADQIHTFVTTGSLTLTNKTLTSAILNTGVSGTAVLDEDNLVSDSATKLATQQSIKAYVDGVVTAQDLDVAGDSGTVAIDLDSETFTISGDTGISTVASANKIEIDLDDTAVTPASYGSATAIPTFTVDQQGRLTAAGSAAITTTLTIDDASSTQDVSLATDDLQFLSASANEITTAVTKVGTDVKVTVGLPDDVTIGQDLIVSRNLTVTGKQVLGSSGTANLYLGNEIAANSANKGARFHSDNNDFFMDFQGDATQLWTFRDYDGSGGIHDRFIFNFVTGDFTATGDLIALDDLDVRSDATIAGDLTVTGSLTINGATTTVSTTNLDVEDAIIMLQAEQTGASATDMGIIMERGTTGANAAIIWDEGADKFIMGTTTETGADNDVTVTVGTLEVGIINAISCDFTNYNLVAGDIPDLPASKITSGTFATARIPNLPASIITSGTFATARIADLAITTDKLAADAVTGTKIGDEEIDSEHYVDGSIDRIHLEADIIDSTKLADDAVDTEHINNDAVTLGTHTTGNYVASLVAGTNVTLTNNSGETATPTVAVANSAIDTLIDARSSAHTITGDASTTEFTITYGFTLTTPTINDVIIQVVDSYASSSYDGDTVFTEVERHSTTQCKVKFSVAPVASHTYKVLCFKIT